MSEVVEEVINNSESYIKIKLVDGYKFYDQVGNELSGDKITYSSDLSRVIIKSDEIATFLISSDSKIYYALRS